MEYVPDWAYRAITTYVLPSINDPASLSAIASQVTSYLAEITESSNLNARSYKNPNSAYSASSTSGMPFDPKAYLSQLLSSQSGGFYGASTNANTNPLAAFLPSIQTLLPTILSPLPPPLRTIILSAVSTTIWLTTYTTSLLSLVFSTVTNLSSSSSSASASSSIPILLISLLALYLAFRVLAIVRRLVSYTVRLALRLTFWAGLVALAAWCYGRGVEKTVGDVAGVVAFWWGEWGRLSAEKNAGTGVYGSYDGGDRGYGGYAGGGRGYGREGIRVR